MDEKPVKHIYYSCPFCGKMFSSESEAEYCLVMHKENRLISNYIGFKCGDDFPSEVALSTKDGRVAVYTRSP